MSGNPPVRGVPDVGRYANLSQSRYDQVDMERRGGAGHYRQLPVTLEEEAMAGGWLPGATPSGPADTLDRLYTLGMRGEPGYDDDPVPMQPFQGKYAPGTGHPDIMAGDTAGYD